jgi:tetratricopeptide (TPR) repeat protein
MRAFAAMVLAVSLFAPAATAADDPAKAHALELFGESEAAYRAGRFQEAVDKLLEARRIRPEPVLLYNLGRAYEALGKPTEAADAYASYLAEEPRAADRLAIEGRITTLRSQAAALARAKEPPRDPPPEPPREPPNVLDPSILIVLGLAGVGTGIGLSVAADGLHEDAKAETVQETARDEQDRAESLATAATTCVIAGGVVAALGVTWLGLELFVPKRTVSLLPGAREVTFRVRF